MEHHRKRLLSLPTDKVFASSDGEMTHSLLSNGMTSSFRKAMVYVDAVNNRISPTRIRVSIATQMCGIGKEELAEFAKVSKA